MDSLRKKFKEGKKFNGFLNSSVYIAFSLLPLCSSVFAWLCFFLVLKGSKFLFRDQVLQADISAKIVYSIITILKDYGHTMLPTFSHFNS